jgi:hypothetical protein
LIITTKNDIGKATVKAKRITRLPFSIADVAAAQQSESARQTGCVKSIALPMTAVNQ